MCPDCDTTVGRRDFLKGVSGAIALGGASSLWTLPGAYAAPTRSSAAETAVQQLYATLSEKQKRGPDAICFGYDAPDRKKISANWHITKPVIGSDYYTAEQQGLIREIVRGATSPDGFEKLIKQTEYDDGGLEAYSIAVFGQPGEGKFEFELTGRHLTLRVDGDSAEKAAFGGPIVYGHGDEEARSNLYHYQTLQTNKVFGALDEKQMKQALISKAPRESAVELQGSGGTFPGIPVGALSADQRGLVEETLKVLLAPYRQEDIAEVMDILKASGGVESLHMAFYEQGDLNADRTWDIWRVEGPSFVWHFRGAPHVHAYINIGGLKA
jgi:hypothetical protein